MGKTKNELINDALFEAKEFSKDIRRYFYEISKERQLTEQEQKFWDLTHDIHVHTNDAILLFRELTQ